MSNGSLQISDAGFWTDPFAARGEAETKAFQGGFEYGVLLDAPTQVSTNERTTLPLAGLWSRTEEVAQSLSLGSHGVAIAIDTRTNQARVGMPFPPQLKSAPPPDDPSLARYVDLLDCFQADLLEGMDLPWRPATYRVAIGAREFLSNVVSVELTASGGYEDPAVAAFLEEQRASVIPTPDPVFPAATEAEGEDEALPNYEAHDASPEVPTDPGVVLSAERVIVAGEGVRSTLRGSFRLAALPQERVRPDDDGERPDVGDAKATAVVTINLVSCGSESAVPRLVTLRVPSYDEVDVDAEEAVVTGHFNLELFEAGVVRRQPQTYFVTVAAGGQISGPTPIAVLAEESLPFAKS
jgi:hypothetical protein